VRIKSARPDVLLDYPQVQAAASFIRQEPLGYGREEASADSLTSAWWDDVEIIQVRAIGSACSENRCCHKAARS
jgi:hypothetical protein